MGLQPDRKNSQGELPEVEGGFGPPPLQGELLRVLYRVTCPQVDRPPLQSKIAPPTSSVF